MDNDSKLAAIRFWQLESQWVRPLTCGNDSMHALLVGEVLDDEVVLRCPTCGLAQEFVPPKVLAYYERYERSRWPKG